MEQKEVKWTSGKLAQHILVELENMKRDVFKMGLEDVIGDEITDYNLVKEHKVKYTNSIVEGPFGEGSESNVSLDSTIALMLQYGDFYLPEEAKLFIKECYEQEYVNTDNLPITEDKLESGRMILDAFIEAGYPYYSACALTGATFIECGWNVHVFNDLEKSGRGVNNAQISTIGWKNCGEGLFGLTGWKQKEKIIKALGITSPPITFDEDLYNRDYDDRGNKINHLCDLDEEYWCKMAKIYLDEIAKKHNEKLLREILTSDTEYMESLAASYLWKAGCGMEPEFEKAKEIAERYVATHKSQSSNPNYKPVNGFAQQLCVSIILDKYLHGEETLSLEECDIDFSVDVELTGFMSEDDMIRNSYRRGNNGRQHTGSGKFGNVNLVNTPLEPGLFKKNPRGWNIRAACEWINKNSKFISQHACAKFVRKAIEAGGIPTNGRPNWAWEYINYLPTIGFKFLRKVKKAEMKNFKPEPGDIAVYQKNGNPNVPGHICMWTGKQWCSDFKQQNMIVYGHTDEAYLFRFSDSNNSQA